MELPCGHVDGYQDAARLWWFTLRVYVGEYWCPLLGVSFDSIVCCVINMILLKICPHYPPSLSSSQHTPAHIHRFYYYIPVVAVCVVAFLFPSGRRRSSGQKKSKTDSITANDLSFTNGVTVIESDKKIV